MRSETPSIVRVLAHYPEIKDCGVAVPLIAEQCAQKLSYMQRPLPSDCSAADVAEKACEALIRRLLEPEPPVEHGIANYIVVAFRQIAMRAYFGEPKTPHTSRVQQAEFLAYEAEQMDKAERELAATRAIAAARPKRDPREVAAHHARALAEFPPPPSFAAAVRPPAARMEPSGHWNTDLEDHDSRGRGASSIGAIESVDEVAAAGKVGT